MYMVVTNEARGAEAEARGAGPAEEARHTRWGPAGIIITIIIIIIIIFGSENGQNGVSHVIVGPSPNSINNIHYCFYYQ